MFFGLFVVVFFDRIRFCIGLDNIIYKGDS